MSKELSDFETAVYPDTSSAPATNLTGNKLEISGDQKTAAPIDIQELTKLSHDEILKLDAASRITWFENIKENHLELEMIRNHLGLGFTI